VQTNGFTKLPNSLWEAPVSPEAKLTYAAIASFAYGTKTTAWPSQATLARQTGYCERSIRRFAAELEAAGLIRIERRSGTASLYELLAPAGQSGVGSQSGLRVHEPRAEGPHPPGPESAKEDKTKKANEEVSSPAPGSGVRVEGETRGEPGRPFDSWDAESWKLIPDHLKVSVPGFADFGGEGIPRLNGTTLPPSRYWELREHDLRRRVAEAITALRNRPSVDQAAEQA
jgi:Helix-turn-helix domain